MKDRAFEKYDQRIERDEHEKALKKLEAEKTAGTDWIIYEYFCICQSEMLRVWC